MNFLSVNFLAVFVGALIEMGLGFVWYGPFFAKPWMALQGWTEERMRGPGPNPVIYVVPFIGALVTAYVLAVVIGATQMATLAGGAGLGLLVAIGFVLPAFASNYTFSSRPSKLYLIDAGYFVVAWVLIGALLGLWH
jgi:Protein of unknown function (DUF1761)